MTHITQHLTSSVIMVKPIDFGYNSQTGVDNEFQNKPLHNNKSEIQNRALVEFENCVEALNQAKVETLVLGKSHTNNPLPDAIFPNNWFSTRQDGTLITFPMKTPNRQDEVQIKPLLKLLEDNQYNVSSLFDYREILNAREILEGTGSLIFHHPSQRLFAAISERCDRSAVEKFAKQFGYQLTQFNTASANGSPIYHTNVLMSCGENFAVLTEEIIEASKRSSVIKDLEDCVEDVIQITESQMTASFCGNILQLKNKNNEPVIALSMSAYKGFKPQQLKVLEKNGSLIVCDISTIEYVGGGSFRCMLAENFLPKLN